MIRVKLTSICLVLTVGCASSMTMQSLSIGRFAQEPALFERAVSAARSRGYVLTEADPGHGSFALRARSRAQGEAATFRVQCYREGWIEVTPQGRLVDPVGDGYRMPANLAPEYRDLVIAMREALVAPTGEGT